MSKTCLDILNRLLRQCLVAGIDRREIAINTIFYLLGTHRVILDGNVEGSNEFRVVPRATLIVDEGIMRASAEK